MAFKINLKAACKWPEKLSRAIDVDGAFRIGALLAAMRVIAPRKTGDGFERQFEKSENYAPDFAPADAYNVDAYRVMGALFEWDGGESYIVGNYTKPGDVFSLSPVKAGELVFQDVWERGPADGSSSGYDIEKMAKRGEVHSCFASAFPYRYWWQAFNRALKELTKASPQYMRPVVVVEYTEEGSGESFPETETSIGILPYCFSHTPTGTPAMTPDDLCTGWVDLETAKTLKKITGNTPWLLTAEDIDFSGVFCGLDKDERTTPLRSLWASMAHGIGFVNYIDEDAKVKRDIFKDGITTFWRGEIEVKYGAGRLAQLKEDWQGRGDEWRDEFPYHALSSMLAYLDYFERYKIGFALTCEYVDAILQIEHFSKSWIWRRSAQFEVSIPLYGTEDIEIGTFNIKDLNWSEIEKSESERWHYQHPQAHADLGRPDIGASALPIGEGAIDFYVTTLYKNNGQTGPWTAWCDGDNNPFECYLNGGASAMEARLNERAFQALSEADPTSLSGTLTIFASCAADSSITRVVERSWNDLKAFRNWGYIPEDGLPYAPNLADHYASDYLRYFFIRTSHSCAIAKQHNFNIAAKLNDEVGIPANGELLPAMPDISQDDGTIKVTLKGIAEKMFEVQESPNGETMIFFVELPGRTEYIELPMPYIFSNTSHGRVRVWPPEQPTQSLTEELRFMVPSRGVATVDVDSKPPETDINFTSKSSRLEQIRSISFVKYDKNVIYPD